LATRRRFRIGATGPLGIDDTLGGGDALDRGTGYRRGEVKPFDAEANQSTPARELFGTGEIAPVIVLPPTSMVPPPESGGDSPGPAGTEGEGPGSGGGPGSSGDDAGVEHKGGLIKGKGEEKVTALAGEFVIQRSAVKKYGVDFLNKLNAGTIQAVPHDKFDAKKHFSNGKAEPKMLPKASLARYR